jgi:hypothetical protein
VALAVAGLVAYLAPHSTKSRRAEWRDLSSQVGPVTLAFSERRLFRDRRQLAAYLRSVGGRTPKVDFRARQVLFLSPGPRSSTGYAVDVLEVTEGDGKVTVKVRERAPSLGEHVVPEVTSPYRLISLPAGKEVFVDWTGR